MPSHRIRIGIFWILIALLEAIPPYLNSVSGYIIHDLAETIYHAKEFTLGRLPYTEIFSHHFLGYVIPFWIVDEVFRLGTTEVFVMQWAYHMLSTMLVYCIVKNISGDFRFAALGAFASSTAGWFPLFFGTTFNYQAYSIPLIYAVTYLILTSFRADSRVRLGLAAAIQSFLVMGDQRCLVFLLLFSAAFSELKKLAVLGSTLASFLAPLLVALCYLVYTDAISQFFEQTILFPIFYRNATFDGGGIREGIALLSVGVSSEPFACAGFFGMAVMLLREKSGRIKVLLLALIVSSGIYVLSGGRFFPNYMQVMMAPLLLGAVLFPFYLKSSHLPMRAGFILILILAVSSFWRVMGVDYRSRDAGILREISSVVSQNSSPGENVLVWGYCPQVYVFSNRFSTFKDMGLITFAGGLFHIAPPGQHEYGRQLMHQFEEHIRSEPPRLIIIADELHGNVGQKFPLGCIFSSAEEDAKQDLNLIRPRLVNYDPIYTREIRGVSIAIYKTKAASR
ncbi:MAG: hypothetical protein J5J00_09000 [Deltaproteobacteria bacterium]|nr:hypothetical protein [Deltaproteobacteria bacterium]